MTQTPHDLIRAEIERLRIANTETHEGHTCAIDGDISHLLSALDCAVTALDSINSIVTASSQHQLVQIIKTHIDLAEKTTETISKILRGEG